VSDVPGSATHLVVRGVGALAADLVAQAAELVAVLARQAGQGASAGQAERILARASALSVSNELAFTRAARALEASNSGGQADELALSRSLADAVEVPLQVCQVASDLVRLAAQLATGPMSQRWADLCGVAQLAAVACDTAALLVRANLGADPADPRHSLADETAAAATAAAQRLREKFLPA
jgi:formiminotetrahydrofolate cyclodeaminase